MRWRAAIALGSNLGDRLHILREAVASLMELGELAGVSALYETAPVGGPEQEDYLNAVVVLDTDLAPEDLLTRLHRIEADAGRERLERWGPRTLDLDLIAMTDAAGVPVVRDTDRLSLPHPRAHERRFVLEPLVDVWPQARVGSGEAAPAALKALGEQQVIRLSLDWLAPRRKTAVGLVVVQFVLLAFFAVVAATTGDLPGALGIREWLGAGLTVVGAVLGAWGVVALGSALTPLPEPRRGTELVAVPPYRWVRHPIYSGLVFGMFGFALLLGTVPGIVTAAIVTGFFWLKAGYEESRLRQAVPGYAAYRSRVRGRLIPMGLRRS